LPSGASQVIPVPLFIVARTGLIHPILDHGLSGGMGAFPMACHNIPAISRFFYTSLKSALSMQEIAERESESSRYIGEFLFRKQKKNYGSLYPFPRMA
jgi:hypothetical protein